MDRINVRVDKRTKQELEAEAREKGVSPSEIVRTILEQHLKDRPKRESCLDIALRIGLIGVYKDTPSDLSTNPEHFEGFGHD
jgi:hypothetical protein